VAGCLCAANYMGRHHNQERRIVLLSILARQIIQAGNLDLVNSLSTSTDSPCFSVTTPE
jgi:hypothetical protein